MASNIKFLVINEKRVQNIYAFLFDHLEYITNSMKEKNCKYNYILELLAWHALINILLTRSTDKKLTRKLMDGFSLFGYLFFKKNHKIVHGNRGEIRIASKQTNTPQTLTKGTVMAHYRAKVQRPEFEAYCLPFSPPTHCLPPLSKSDLNLCALVKTDLRARCVAQSYHTCWWHFKIPIQVSRKRERTC